VNPLTFALYGSVLIWLKSYLRETGRKLVVIGIDLPNTLNPRDDLEQLSTDIEILDPIVKPEVDALRQSLASISGNPPWSHQRNGGNWTQLCETRHSLDHAVKITIDGLGPDSYQASRE
jgi:erythromycin esterase